MAGANNEGDELRQALLEYTVDHLGEPLVVLDERGQVLGANRTAREGPALELVDLLSVDGPLGAFWSELRARGQATAEVPAPGEPSRRWLLHAFAVRRAFVLRMRSCELSAGERADAEHRRLESLGLLAAGVVHDLNNLLAPIAILTETLARDSSDTARALAGEIRLAVERATELTRHALSVARPADSGAARLNVAEVVTALVPLIQRVVGSRVDVSLQASEDVPTALVDRARLEHALLNLAANARDAMPRGGTLTLRVAKVVPGDASAAEPDRCEYVALTVADTGVGMCSSVTDRVFERFFTTKHERGTGLGLAAVREFVRDAAGLISVSSRPGCGTAVAVFLPVVEREERPTLPALPKRTVAM